ncbi:MAG: glycoside hydrolase family 127 protein [Clostridiales bacterium]|nr:glycoside hydrolase family 127 protein [Clostridiales bacterium]
MNEPKKVQTSIDLKKVKVQDEFWSHIQQLMLDVVIPYQEDVLHDRIPGVEKSHAVENFRIAAGEAEGQFYGMVFQDSDVAKWLEAVAYSLLIRPDAALEKRADELIALVGRAQQEDGYLNTYFTVKEPEHRWQNLRECHELYCAGHLIEAAVAYYEATGKDAFLQIMRRYADLICARFGEEAVRGIPGHQEIELALVKLYRVTGDEKYLKTAQYFINERGVQPLYFDEEEARRNWHHWSGGPVDNDYYQARLPVREQQVATGHSVRAVYMYTAMADLAAETHDPALLEACKRLWNNVVNKQMYVTGGIGSTRHGEAFTFDYDLPNDTIYAETCASVGLVFFARRMLEADVNSCYGDIMEKELYGGILSGMQLDGKRFFYVNPLEVVPGLSGRQEEYKHALPQRPGWYACACCPPNVARLMTSLGQYAWGQNEDTIFAHLYMGSEADFDLRGGVKLCCESQYAWDGKVRYTFLKADGNFALALRKPEWAKSFQLSVNGETLQPVEKNGYLYITRQWNTGDTVEILFPMEVRRIYCNPAVRENAGCVALCRGPVVYALEEADNGKNLAALRLGRDVEIHTEKQSGELGDITLLKAVGKRLAPTEDLYTDIPFAQQEASITFIPYYAWGNRGLGEMRVWIHE